MADNRLTLLAQGQQNQFPNNTNKLLYHASNAALLNNAVQQYPFIASHDVSLATHPKDKKDWGYAETWTPGDAGWQGTQAQGYVNRPSEFPLKGLGIDIYNPAGMGVNDIAGEVMHGDARANAARDVLTQSLTEQQKNILRQQGDYQMTNAPEDIKMRNAADSMMRGYVVGQWPKEAIDEMQLSPNQRANLDSLKQYMTTGK
jgi:hypothetical protein